VEGVEAPDVARGTARERAIARTDLQVHLVQVERPAQAAQLALRIALAARVRFGIEAEPSRRYQHMPSYTPAIERESETRTKSMIVWPSATRLGTSANSGAPLPMTMVCACSSTSSIDGTMSREMCGILFRM